MGLLGLKKNKEKRAEGKKRRRWGEGRGKEPSAHFSMHSPSIGESPLRLQIGESRRILSRKDVLYLEVGERSAVRSLPI